MSCVIGSPLQQLHPIQSVVMLKLSAMHLAELAVQLAEVSNELLYWYHFKVLLYLVL